MRRFSPVASGQRDGFHALANAPVSGTVMVPAAKSPSVPERDATLDAFVTPDDEPDEPSDGEPTEADEGVLDADGDTEADSVDDEVAASDSVDREGVTERAVTTFAWSPEGSACESCGESVTRRWRTDAGFVCGDCVDWERTPNE
mgnify:CR=1 FL=1